MNAQSLVVGMLVLGCSAYVLWALIPRALRTHAVKLMLKLPLPGTVRQRLSATGTRAGGCACEGCDAAKPTSAPAVHVVKFARRRER